MCVIGYELNLTTHPRVKRGSPSKGRGVTFDVTSLKYIYMHETSDVSISRYYVYILLSLTDEGLYIGFTNDLKRRLTQHASGQVKSTKIRIPFKLIHYEYFINEKDAKAREEFLKSGYGRKQLKEFLKNTLTSS